MLVWLIVKIILSTKYHFTTRSWMPTKVMGSRWRVAMFISFNKEIPRAKSFCQKNPQETVSWQPKSWAVKPDLLHVWTLNSLVLPILSDCSEEVGVFAGLIGGAPVVRGPLKGALCAVGDDNRLEEPGHPCYGLHRVWAGRSQDSHHRVERGDLVLVGTDLVGVKPIRYQSGMVTICIYFSCHYSFH